MRSFTVMLMERSSNTATTFNKNLFRKISLNHGLGFKQHLAQQNFSTINAFQMSSGVCHNGVQSMNFKNMLSGL